MKHAPVMMPPHTKAIQMGRDMAKEDFFRKLHAFSGALSAQTELDKSAIETTLNWGRDVAI